MAEIAPLNPPPRRYRLTIEHHHDGRASVLIVGIADGHKTRATIAAILRAALAAIEDGHDGL